MLAAHAAFLTGVGLPPPTITSISPTYFYTARWVGFTITGTNFVPGATTVSADIAGGNVTSISVNAAGTSLTVSFYAVSAGSSAVTVTTPFGSASSQVITAAVEPPPPPPDTRPAPTFTGVSPASAPDSTNRTIYGTNFMASHYYYGTVPLYVLVSSFAYASVISRTDTSAVISTAGLKATYGSGPWPLSIYTGGGGSGWIAGPSITFT